MEIRTNLTEANLAAAVELNSAEWLRLEGRSPWVELHDARLGFREVCKLSFWKYGKMRQLRKHP